MQSPSLYTTVLLTINEMYVLINCNLFIQKPLQYVLRLDLKKKGIKCPQSPLCSSNPET